MFYFFVIAAPGLLMLFALAMQGLEKRLGNSSPTEEQVEDFLHHANSDEIEALVSEGMTEALDVLDERREQDTAARISPSS